MCGRFSLVATDRALSNRFHRADWPAGRKPRYNIAPTQPVLCLRWEEGETRPVWLRWGLVPRFAADPSGAARMINARGETLLEKPSFRNLVGKNRCLILADGFYEWHSPSGDFSGKSPKTPYHFRLPGGEPFAFAGLFDRWNHPGTGEVLETVTLVNHAAPPWMAWCHHRAPIVLDEANCQRWLDPREDARGKLGDFLAPWPPAGFEYFPVSTAVNSVRNDGPECLVAGLAGEPPVEPGTRQGFLF
jgi:putative SOS response-associated peptidase YedK